MKVRTEGPGSVRASTVFLYDLVRGDVRSVGAPLDQLVALSSKERISILDQSAGAACRLL